MKNYLPLFFVLMPLVIMGATCHEPYSEEEEFLINSVAFSPDGQTLAGGISGGTAKTAKLWDVNTGSEIGTVGWHASGVLSVAFSPDGKTLASGSWDNTVRLWKVNTGKRIRTLEGYPGR